MKHPIRPLEQELCPKLGHMQGELVTEAVIQQSKLIVFELPVSAKGTPLH